MSPSNERRTSIDLKSSFAAPSTQVMPSLLPSAAFPSEQPVSPVSPGTEGYEGERLHEMFLSARHPAPYIQEPGRTEGSSPREPDVGSISAQSNRGRIFEPFFTVIEDGQTGAQHHPHVHYIFSDDDTESMTNGIFSALNDRFYESTGERSEDLGSAASSNLKERFLIVDVNQDGESIASARSLAPGWQILGHSVTTAPTFGESSNRADAGMMLRIEGQERPRAEAEHEWLHHSKETTNEELLDSMNRLASQFHRELDTLRRLASFNLDADLSTLESRP